MDPLSSLSIRKIFLHCFVFSSALLIVACTVLVLEVSALPHAQGGPSIPTGETHAPRFLEEVNKSSGGLWGIPGGNLTEAASWLLAPTGDGGQPAEGFARHGATLFWFVLGVQVFILILQLCKVIQDHKDKGPLGIVASWDFIGAVFTFVSLYCLDEVAKCNFIGDNVFIWDGLADGKSVSVIATSIATATGEACQQFDLGGIAAQCEEARREYETCKETSSRPSRCKEDGACALWTSEGHPVVAFANQLQGWVPITAYLLGNVARLVFFLFGWYQESHAKPEEEDGPMEGWMKGALQDGFAYATMMFVSQLSLEDDCLGVTYLTDLHSFFGTYAFFMKVFVTIGILGFVFPVVVALCAFLGKEIPQILSLLVCGYMVMSIVGSFAAFVYSNILIIVGTFQEPELPNILGLVFAWVGLGSSLLPFFLEKNEPLDLLGCEPDEDESVE